MEHMSAAKLRLETNESRETKFCYKSLRKDMRSDECFVLRMMPKKSNERAHLCT